MTLRTLPMFPLGSVLLPTMLLPLHVFEPRYRELMQDVLDGDRRFGVVLIERGHEVGGEDVRSAVGTVAQILDARELDDGRWMCVASGVQRLRVHRWLDDAPYPRAEVELVTEQMDVGSADVLAETVTVLRRVLGMAAELGDEVAPATTPIAEDPAVAAWQVAALAPFGPLDTQRLLLLDDPDARLDAVQRGLREVEAELHLRLTVGSGPSDGPT